MTTDDSVDRLSELAEAVEIRFESYRKQDAFREISIVIDNSNPNQETLIVHVDREDASSLADKVETFLRKRGARTEREAHSDTDVRVLATLD